MKAWLPTLLLFFSPELGNAGGATIGFMPRLKGEPTRINQTNFYTSGSKTSHPLTFSTLPKAGNTIVVAFYTWKDANHTVSVTDNNSNTYQLACTRSLTSGSDRYVTGIYYAKNIKVTAGTFTVTITPSPSSEMGARAMEYTGLDPVAPLDYGTSVQGSGTSVSTASVNVTAAHTLLIGTVSEDSWGGDTLTPTNGFTSLGSTSAGTNPMGGLYEKIVTTKGSHSGTWTLSGSMPWTTCLGAFN